jgi:hypothetical protein
LIGETPDVTYPFSHEGRLDRFEPQATPHPFVEAGNRTFNTLLRLRSPNWPAALYVGDATLWSAAFGGLPSLTKLWRNVASM